MAITTYDALKTAVARFLRRDDLEADIPNFIALAEAQMNRRLRVRRMVQRVTATLTDEYSAVPDGYLGVRSFSLEGEPPRPLRFLTPDRMDELGSASGEPRFFSVVGGEFRFHPAPSSAVTGILTFWQAPTALSAEAPSNWLLETHPDAYLYGALVQSAPFLRADERLAVWGQLFTTVLDDIAQADQAEAHGGPLNLSASVDMLSPP